jgi:hypothetical protein
MSTAFLANGHRRPLDFVVTGTPRSGTKYLATVLRRLGIDCWHERSFNPWYVMTEAYRLNDRPWGDSSWLAAPFLHLLPADTKVFHVVREPLDALNSIIGTRQLNKPRPSDFQQFLAMHCWNDERHTSIDVGLDAQTFWVRWNRMIEDSGRVSLRFRVDEISSALPVIVSEIGASHLTGQDIAVAVEAVPKDVNTREHRCPVRLVRSDLTTECVDAARRYGYDY